MKPNHDMRCDEKCGIMHIRQTCVVIAAVFCIDTLQIERKVVVMDSPFRIPIELIKCSSRSLYSVSPYSYCFASFRLGLSTTIAIRYG